MYSGDEFYDDDITSGPWEGLEDDEWIDAQWNSACVPWTTYEEYVEYNNSVLKG